MYKIQNDLPHFSCDIRQTVTMVKNILLNSEASLRGVLWKKNSLQDWSYQRILT